MSAGRQPVGWVERSDTHRLQAGDGYRFRSTHPTCSILTPLASKGFTLIELVIVITLIVFLMGIFMNRIVFYQEQAEKVAMEQVAGAIQSALIMQYGQILTRGKPADVAALITDNPMSWLQKKPRNYSGEFYEPTPLSVSSGNWMFDLKSRDLIYVLRTADYFKPGKDGKKWIRFHATLDYEQSRLPSPQDKQDAGKANSMHRPGTPAELTGIVFAPVEPYSWF